MAKKKIASGKSDLASSSSDILRSPAELLYADELNALQASDTFARPPGWHLSPRAVRTFVLGSEAAPLGENSPEITRKFYGNDALVDRSIVTLIGNRGLMLIGEPGTAKSMLSELLAAAVSGGSELTIQGTAGTTEDQIKYSWNYALLLSEGPTRRSLVPAPLFRGLSEGRVVRFEEITRCPAEIQDTLISVLSDKVLHIPEFEGADAVLHAKPGFNIIATANTRDRGVHEMSAALRRRFNFETVTPISDPEFELELVLKQAGALLHQCGAEARLDRDVVRVLVDAFHELRNGRTKEGGVVEKPSSVLSTAEAVSVVMSAGIDAAHFGDGTVSGVHLARQLTGAVLKDDEGDVKKVRQYFEVVVKARASTDTNWKDFYTARDQL
ncbi:MAG: AAA family ATPase [Planctomycetaceae bacterium]|nr:AAA family ATPase [Planctomycetaceae bacterium]